MARKLEPVASVANKSWYTRLIQTGLFVAVSVWASGLAQTRLAKTLITGRAVNYHATAPCAVILSALTRAILSDGNEAVYSALFPAKQSTTISEAATRTGEGVSIQLTRKPEILRKLKRGSLVVWSVTHILVRYAEILRAYIFTILKPSQNSQSYGTKWRTA